jgi:putative YhbY family RNA-binding protein
MPQIQLTPAERREHRANAHHLDPVVLVGGDGLTPAVQKEIDAALNAHGLIKVRIFNDDRAARELMYQQLAADLNAAPIQHIGKLLVLWRPQPAKERTPDEDRMPGPRDVKVLKYSKRGGQRPKSSNCACWATSASRPAGRSSGPRSPSSNRSRNARLTEPHDSRSIGA